MLCGDVAMSRSALYRLLEPQGRLARFIQQAKLTAARHTLLDPANRASVSSLAQPFCLSNTLAFSGAFKTKFGYSPSDVGDAGRLGSADMSVRPASRLRDILVTR